MDALYPRFQYGAGRYKWIADGNSLTAGDGSTNNAGRWPDQAALLYPLAGNGVAPVNIAVSGQATASAGGPSTMTGRAASFLYPQFVTNRLNILTVLEFTNEVKFNGSNGAAAWAVLKAYCLAARAAATAAGAKLAIIIGTAPPALYSSVTQDVIIARNNALKVANDLARRDYRQAGADAVADIAAQAPYATIFANGVYTSQVFIASGAYNADNVHGTNSIYGTYYARPMAAAMRRVRNR